MVGDGTASRSLPALGLVVALVAVLGTALFAWTLGGGGVPIALALVAVAVAVWRRG